MNNIDEGKLWSFLRKVMSQGGDIQNDATGHEMHSARLDAAAAERTTELLALLGETRPPASALTFDAFRAANVARGMKWRPEGLASWSPSDWLTALTGELGELASLLKMRNRERDGLPGNKFSPTDQMVADEIADVLTYLDLLAATLGVDLGRAAAHKFNEVSERVGFPDRIELDVPRALVAVTDEQFNRILHQFHNYIEFRYYARRAMNFAIAEFCRINGLMEPKC